MEYQLAGMREARAGFAGLLDEAGRGTITLITRHGRTVAAVIPPELLEQIGQPRPAVEEAADALRGALRTLEPLLTPPAAYRVPDPARAGRSVLVVASLESLRGPASGVVELPLRLFWSADDRSWDLSRPTDLRAMYETVLGQASRPEDLTGWLDAATLVRIWPDLYLPKAVRKAWEDRHPALRATADVAR